MSILTVPSKEHHDVNLVNHWSTDYQLPSACVSLSDTCPTCLLKPCWPGLMETAHVQGLLPAEHHLCSHCAGRQGLKHVLAVALCWDHFEKLRGLQKSKDTASFLANICFQLPGVISFLPFSSPHCFYLFHTLY